MVQVGGCLLKKVATEELVGDRGREVQGFGYFGGETTSGVRGMYRVWIFIF